MRRLLYVFLISFFVLAAACSDEEENGRTNIQTFPDSGNNSTDGGDAGNNTTPDDGGMEDDATSMDMAMDDGGTTELCSLNAANPGFLNGIWNLNVSEITRFRLRLCHDLDADPALVGFYEELSTGITGEILNPTFSLDPFVFSTNWFVEDGGEEYAFGFSQSMRIDDNTISARLNNGRLMETESARLEKQDQQ